MRVCAFVSSSTYEELAKLRMMLFCSELDASVRLSYCKYAWAVSGVDLVHKTHMKRCAPCRVSVSG